MRPVDRSRLVLAAALSLPTLAGCTSRDHRPEQAPEIDPELASQEEESVSLAERADAVQEKVTRRIRAAAHWLDTFLGGERSLEEENETRARLRFDVDVEDGEGVGFDVRPDIRVALPGTKERVQLTISGDGDSDSDLTDDTAEDIREEFENTDEENISIGANYFLRDTTRNNVRIGAGFTSGPAVYGEVRYRLLASLGSWDFRGTERVRYYTDNGFESRTTVDFERRLSRLHFFRATTRGTWFEEEPGYFYSQSLSFYHLIGPTRLMVYELVGSFVTDPNHVLDQGLVRVRFRERLWRDWIYLEIAPQLELPREEDYEAVPGILFRLDFSFSPEERS